MENEKSWINWEDWEAEKAWEKARRDEFFKDNPMAYEFLYKMIWTRLVERIKERAETEWKKLCN